MPKPSAKHPFFAHKCRTSELGARQAHARRPLVKARPTVASIGLVICLSDVLQRCASAMCFRDEPYKAKPVIAL
ncbi:MAG: hypothetical protein EBZ84_03835 [Betaproteobacteria bacterium]|nr:hypothetical protein [Betaproteobacteria bacterium]